MIRPHRRLMASVLPGRVGSIELNGNTSLFRDADVLSFAFDWRYEIGVEQGVIFHFLPGENPVVAGFDVISRGSNGHAGPASPLDKTVLEPGELDLDMSTTVVPSLAAAGHRAQNTSYLYRFRSQNDTYSRFWLGALVTFIPDSRASVSPTRTLFT
jgi:hypothetical protein